MCKWGNEPYFKLRWIFMEMSVGRGADPWVGEGTYATGTTSRGVMSHSYRSTHPKRGAYPGSSRLGWRPPARIPAAWLSSFPIGSHSDTIRTQSQRTLRHKNYYYAYMIFVTSKWIYALIKIIYKNILLYIKRYFLKSWDKRIMYVSAQHVWHWQTASFILSGLFISIGNWCSNYVSYRRKKRYVRSYSSNIFQMCLWPSEGWYFSVHFICSLIIHAKRSQQYIHDRLEMWSGL